MRFERIGCYDVTALIGQSGMGQVYQATDTKLRSSTGRCQIPLLVRFAPGSCLPDVGMSKQARRFGRYRIRLRR